MAKKQQLPKHVYYKGRINKYLYFEKRGWPTIKFKTQDANHPDFFAEYAAVIRGDIKYKNIDIKDLFSIEHTFVKEYLCFLEAREDAHLGNLLYNLALYDIEIVEKNKRGIKIVTGGNQYNIKPQFGRQDASKGYFLNIEISNDSISYSNLESLDIDGQIRKFEGFFYKNKKCIAVGINNKKTKFFEYK